MSISSSAYSGKACPPLDADEDMRQPQSSELRMPVTRIAIAGLGAIGRALARRLAAGVPGVTLACAAARDRARAQAWLDEQKIACPLVELDAFPQHADLAIECAPAAIIEDICRPML